MKILILVGENSNTDPDTLVRLCHDLPAKMRDLSPQGKEDSIQL